MTTQELQLLVHKVCKRKFTRRDDRKTKNTYNQLVNVIKAGKLNLCPEK